MATPITGGTAFDFGAAAQANAAQPQAPTSPSASVQPPARIQPSADTVKLSDGAQVRLLKTQGQSVSEIAINTALTTETVNGYLGITPAPLPTVVANK